MVDKLLGLESRQVLMGMSRLCGRIALEGWRMLVETVIVGDEYTEIDLMVGGIHEKVLHVLGDMKMRVGQAVDLESELETHKEEEG